MPSVTAEILLASLEYRSVREALSNLADRLSHQLAGETDPQVIHQMLSDEHRDALVTLQEVE